MDSKKTRVLFLIRRLDIGGAERQLVELIRALDQTLFGITVATFYPEGALLPLVESFAGIQVVCLQKSGRWDIASFLWRWMQLIKQVRPHLIYGYLSVANEYALLAGKIFGVKVVWGLRASDMDLSKYDWTARLMFRIGAWLSPFTDKIIVNSQAGKAHHFQRGYKASRMIVIPNGIDTSFFCPDHAAGRSLRKEWDIPKDCLVVGIVGRLDLVKDYPTFLQTAALLSKKLPQVKFVCIGAGSPSYTDYLKAMAQSLGLEHCLIWLHERSDMPAIYNALDVLCLSSTSEGFPNVIGEAMACEIPCVVTDVGDSKRIVGETGELVPTQDPQMMAQALFRLLSLNRSQRNKLGVDARTRIVNGFSLDKMVASTRAVFDELYPGK